MLSTSLNQFVDASVRATNMPYQTYSFGLKGDLVITATAYEGTYILNDGFKTPQDIYIDSEDNVYIADTGNKRIYKFNPDTEITQEIGVGILESPTGIFVDKEFDIYVADTKLNQVLWFNKTGALIKTYDRPDEPLFGEDTFYRPRKVLVDARKNVYVITEGGSNGIIQMDVNGDFLGYYGVNQVQLSLSLYFRRSLMSEEERSKISLIPKPTSNFAIDNKGLLYTIINNEYEMPLKKLNIEGNNVLTGYSLHDPYFTDIFVDDNGMIYTISNNDEAKAIISVHDSYGNLIFVFGDKTPGSLKIGKFDDPQGIATDKNGDIWVLDSTAGNVQVFTKTEFANMVLSAIIAYEKGDYEKAQTLFLEVVRHNAMFGLAHSNLGKLYQKDNQYDLALESYKIANNKMGYSEVYWELRDQWIANNLLNLILLLIGIYALILLFKKYKNNFIFYQKFKIKIKAYKEKPLFKELSLLKRILRDPLDVVYEIKFRQSVRLRTASMLYVVFIFLNIICDFYIKGFLFKGFNDNIVLSYEILKWFIPLILLGIANHLINSLQSGEGFYRDLYIGIIYALSPILLFKLPIDIISNVLTFNESFIYRLAYLIMYGWSVVNVIIVIKEINNYKVKQLIVNLILTIFTMLIMIILYLVINVLLSQLLLFIEGILQEVFLND